MPVRALDGDVRMHDPSTVIRADGKFYVYGTGNGLPGFVSDDGWTRRRTGQVMQAVPGGRPGPEVLAKGGNNTWAPDIVRSGDRYFLYYSAPGRQPKSAIGLLVGTTLDPTSTDYKWEGAGPVVWSDGVEDCNVIDPGVFRDPPTDRCGSLTGRTSATSAWSNSIPGPASGCFRIASRSTSRSTPRRRS